MRGAGWLLAIQLAVSAASGEPGAPVPAPAPARVLNAFTFQTRDLACLVTPIGELNGLSIEAKTRVVPVTRAGQATWNLEHFLDSRGSGQFVPREIRRQGVERPSGASVRLIHRPFDPWRVGAATLFTPFEDDRIDIECRFRFEEDRPGFEAFVASYFDPAYQPFLRLAGGWVSPEIQGREQHFFARDEAAKALAGDGRWDWLKEAGYPPVVRAETFALPVIVSVLREPGETKLAPEGPAWEEGRWALIQMTRPGDCHVLSPNAFANAHDFGLVGADVKAGMEVVVRARILWRKLRSLEEAEEAHRAFMREFR